MYHDTQAWPCKHKICILSLKWNNLHEESNAPKLTLEGVVCFPAKITAIRETSLDFILQPYIPGTMSNKGQKY